MIPALRLVHEHLRSYDGKQYVRERRLREVFRGWGVREGLKEGLREVFREGLRNVLRELMNSNCVSRVRVLVHYGQAIHLCDDQFRDP